MTYHVDDSRHKRTGDYSLPEPIAALLVELAQPANSARIALLQQFETEMRQALEQFAAIHNISVVCERVNLDQIAEHLQAPLLSSMRSDFDVALLTPPFVPIRRLPDGQREQLRATELPSYATAELAYPLMMSHLLSLRGEVVALVSEMALRQAGRPGIRELLMREYRVDFVVLFPQVSAWELPPRIGVMKLARRGDSAAGPVLFSIVNNWSDWSAIQPLLNLYHEIAAKKPISIQMDSVGSSTLFSLFMEETLPFGTLLPTQLYYARFIQAGFDRYETVRLGDIAELTVGLHPGPDARDLGAGEVCLISARCITSDGAIESSRRISDEQLQADRQERWLTEEGDILVGRIMSLSEDAEPKLLRLAIVPLEWEGCYFDSTVIRIRVQRNRWNITPDYIFRILKLEYELRPEFADYVQSQLSAALSSGLHVTAFALEQLDIPVLPESIRRILGRHVDVVDIEHELSQLQESVSLLAEGLDRLKAQAAVEGQDVEEIIAHIEDRIVAFAEQMDRLHTGSYEAQLQDEIDCWDQLEEQSRQFLVTAEWALANFEPDLDFSPITVSVWKCLETELLTKIFGPFRQWVRDREDDLDVFLDTDLHDKTINQKTKLFTLFICGRKLAIGQMLCEFNFVSGQKTIRKSPLLHAFRGFLEAHCGTPEFFLSKHEGISISSIITQESIERYRNSAAHTDVVDRQRACESRDLIIGVLDQLMEAIGMRRVQ